MPITRFLQSLTAHTLRLCGCALLALGGVANAQVPNEFKYSISAPVGSGVQMATRLGECVAIDGGYTVVGVESDNAGGEDSGTVKVFNTTTGALLYILPNPIPETKAQFGLDVAIQGSRVVVGAPFSDADALNGGVAYVYDLSGGTPTVPLYTIHNPSPAANDKFGTAVGISGTRVVIGAIGDATAGPNSGSAYVFDLSSATPGVPVLSIPNPAPADNDRFGVKLAISGNRLVISAYFDDTAAPDSGSAYVYDLNSGTPAVPLVTLSSPSPAEDDLFGWSVAMAGTRVVVGAIGSDAGASDTGVAYVFDVSSGTPGVPIFTLNHPSLRASGYFGTSVAIAGTRVVVGASFDSGGGSAFAYDLGSGSPLTPIRLNNPTPVAGDSFGAAVAISGTRVVVGAPSDGTFYTGSVYGYDLTSATPGTSVVTMNHPSPSENDHFGQAAAVSGNLLVVGVPNDNTGATEAGSAYVYDLNSATPNVPIAELHNPTPNTYDHFGGAVAISGTRVVVAAPMFNRSPLYTDVGIVYVYELSGSTPTVPIVTLNNPTDYTQFGSALAISGNRLFVGAHKESIGNPEIVSDFRYGKIYEYDLNSATPAVSVMQFTNPTLTSRPDFGIALAISGNRLVVGAPREDMEGTRAGRAYVYDLGSGTPTVPAEILYNPNASTDDQFGSAVAISGTRVVVGAALEDITASNAGSAYVFDLASAASGKLVATLNNPSPAVNDNFGATVGIFGATVVIGAPQDDLDGTDVGLAHVYDLSSATPTVPATTLHNPAPAPSDGFGYLAAIDGSRVVIGAPLDDAVAVDKGSVYIFLPGDVTEPPTLISPANNLLTKAPVTVSFSLPEAALPDSVTLSVGATIFRLAPSQETAGTHTFTFDPANPLAAPQIESTNGVPINDGTLAVKITYRDLAGHDARFDQHTGIRLDRVTEPVTLTSPAGGYVATNALTVEYYLLEAAFHSQTVRLRIAATNNRGRIVLEPTASFSSAGVHSITFDPANPGSNPGLENSSPIPPGVYNIAVEYQDLAQNTIAISNVAEGVVILGDPVPPGQVAFTELYRKGGAVPHAGAGGDARIQAGAQWTGFGSPAVNDAGQVAYLGKWKSPAVTVGPKLAAQSGAGIFIDDELLVKVGDPVPGSTDLIFKSFKDPVMDASGHVAFLAAIKGATSATVVPSTSDTVVVTNGRNGQLEVLAREGSPAPEAGGGTFKAFGSVSIKSGASVAARSPRVVVAEPAASQSGVVFTASLLQGSPTVTAANDTGAWWLPSGGAAVRQLVREGADHFFATTGELVKTFSVLKPLAGSPGFGRGQVNGNTAYFFATSTARGHGLILADPNGFETNVLLGDSLHSTILPDAKWAKLSLPSMDESGTNATVLGSLKTGPGGEPTISAKGIFQSLDRGTAWEPIVQTNSEAPGILSGGVPAVFSAFKDPVNSSTCSDVAFIGTAKGVSAPLTSANNDGIWFRPDAGDLMLIAREGDQPAGAPAGAKWKSFSSLALPGGETGPLFTAFLQKGIGSTAGPGGITSASDFALYATDYHGNVQELIRESQPLLGRNVKSFSVLKATSGSGGTTRAFSNQRRVVLLVTFFDKTTAIVAIDLPSNGGV